MKELIEPQILATLELPRQVGKWEAYEHYKDSGVEWLGKIPEHWKIRRLKFVSLINTEVLRENVDSDYILQYIDISNVDSEGKIHGVQELAFRNAPSRARRIVKNGDTILSTVRTYLRAIGYINNPTENLIVSTGFAVLRPRQEISSKFLYRFVQSHEFVNLVVSHSEGVGYPAINPGRLACLPILLPPLQEQQPIAA